MCLQVDLQVHAKVEEQQMTMAAQGHWWLRATGPFLPEPQLFQGNHGAVNGRCHFYETAFSLQDISWLKRSAVLIFFFF